ncbi:unnamed protein product [Sphenostylis stenocarpa]|uniref:Major facilitator superfamily (MFS) profile domain-containing protein n=1 Tax=Sphenostylis stenocarpa TaxID=92480 RepID=A0AA86SGH2_9FABA|nr:unnamed protein product [Sphenostylis stenocarpa]
MSSVIIGGVNVVATVVSIFSVDKFGRRILFLEGGIQMLVCRLVVGTMIAMKFGVSGEGSFTNGEASLLLFFICAYVAAYAWSWGPLGWLVPSEICSLEVRSAGQSTNVAVNVLFTFVIAQIFLTMLCHLKFGLFFFFAGFVLIMTIFVALFLPETRNVRIEEMNRMAGGALVTLENGRQYEGKITTFVLVTCFVAAMGGLLFGYDLGITGGVTSMEPFLIKFFPSVYKQMQDESNHESQYCKFDNELLTLFTSSLYLAALVASFCASTTTRMMGRKTSMFVGGLFFLVGALLNGFAINIEMLIIGRLLLGFSVGYCNRSRTVYLFEMAPTTIRGALNIGFQMMITIGILIANLINYGTAKLEYGWRISLGIGAVPAIMLCVGSLFLGDTPNSLVERGKIEAAKKMLQRIRGVDNVDEEFQELVDATKAAKDVEHPWKNIIQPKYRPQLTFCSLIPFFQQFTGINVIMFYAPVLFKTLGFGSDTSLMSSVITGGVNVVATVVSIFSVDKFGRRILFLEGGIQMLVCQLAVGTMIAMKFGVSGEGSFTNGEASLLLFFICAYVAAYAWSWGPLGWLVPSEICSLEVRSAGQSTNVAVNMLFTFVIAQIFLTMLCHLKFGLFFFFAGFVLIMTIFVALFLPETRNVRIEEMNRMAGGALVTLENGRQYEGKITTFVLVTCFVAAMGGLLFGYDLGITGGVTSMEPFLIKFFPSVYKQMQDESNHESQYCKFDNELLTLFTSSLYLARISSFFLCFHHHKNDGTQDLNVCRLLLGFGVGYCNQSVPVYLSEMAPTTIRGALNIGFQMMITIGILIANLINYGTAKLEYGWRISLGIGAVPAIMLCVGSLFLGDTPNSLVERGKIEAAKKMLQRIRGVDNVDEEFQELVDATKATKDVEHPWKNIIQPKYRPQLTFCSLDSILPTIHRYQCVNVVATVVSIFSVDKFGRRILFLEGGIQMLVCQLAVGTMIAMKFGVSGEGSFTNGEASLLLFFICAYVAAYAWSWGPLGWLVPSEICSLEVRSAGQSTNVAVNMLFTFVIAQIFLTMLCHLKFGLFFFFAGFVLIMTIFVALFLPETRNVRIEEMNRILFFIIAFG